MRRDAGEGSSKEEGRAGQGNFHHDTGRAGQGRAEGARGAARRARGGRGKKGPPLRVFTGPPAPALGCIAGATVPMAVERRASVLGRSAPSRSRGLSFSFDGAADNLTQG